MYFDVFNQEHYLHLWYQIFSTEISDLELITNSFYRETSVPNEQIQYNFISMTNVLGIFTAVKKSIDYRTVFDNV